MTSADDATRRGNDCLGKPFCQHEAHEPGGFARPDGIPPAPQQDAEPFPAFRDQQQFLEVLRAFCSFLSGPTSPLDRDDQRRAARLLEDLPSFKQPEPQPADASPLINLVRQLSVERYSMGYNVGQGHTVAATRDEAKAAALLARIDAEVQQLYGGLRGYGRTLEEIAAVLGHNGPMEPDLVTQVRRLVGRQPVQALHYSGMPLWLHRCGAPTPWTTPTDTTHCANCGMPGPWRPLLVAAPAGDVTPEVLPTDAELDIRIGEVTAERDNARAGAQRNRELLDEVARLLGVPETGDLLDAVTERLALSSRLADMASLRERERDEVRAQIETQAGNFLTATNTLVAQLHDAHAQTDAEIVQADDIAAWADRLAWAALKRTGVRETEEASGNEELWRLALDALTALVLRLPEVPEGTVALVGVSSGARYPWNAHLNGWIFDQSETGVMSLGELLDREDLRVELAPPREPRTLAEIWAEMPDAQATVRGLSSELAEALDREVAADTSKRGAEDA